jgi:hypothetical protein
VVTGDYEPNDEEADWPSDDEKDEELAVRFYFIMSETLAYNIHIC